MRGERKRWFRPVEFPHQNGEHGADVAAKVAIRIVKLQRRRDENFGQRFNRPGDHLWEVVNANMKWRLRYDELSDKDKQEFIADGKSRFCAGEKFGKYHLDPGKGGKGLRTDEVPGPRPRLQYGGAQEYLDAQAVVMSNVNREEDWTGWVLHQKIYIVGVLVDMIGAERPWSTENRDSILSFKQNIGKEREFMDRWRETLESA